MRGEKSTHKGAAFSLTRLAVPLKLFIIVGFVLTLVAVIIATLSSENIYSLVMTVFAATGVVAAFYLLVQLDVANQRVASLIEERNVVAQTLSDAMQMVHDRDILITEASHRVRNDLTTLASMVRLQKNKLGHGQGGSILGAVEFRLGVLVKVHQRLKSVGGESSIDTQSFLGDLIHDLKASLIGFRPVQVLTHIESHNLTHKRAVALGLIMNEALVNSTKYAFDEDDDGTVIISFKKDGDDFVFTLLDDGSGNDGTIRGTGLGRKLMDAMAQQLAGTLNVTVDGGTKVEIRFPVVVAMSE